MRISPLCLFVLSIFSVLEFGLFPAQGRGGDLSDFFTTRTRTLAEKQAGAARQSGRNASSQSFGSYGNPRNEKQKAKQKAIQTYLAVLVPVMDIPTQVKHLPVEQAVPVDENSPEKSWTAHYERFKNSLRPDVKYLWQSNANRENTVIILTPEYVTTLKKNMDVIMWYRNQLDEQGAGEEHEGTQSFKIFVDYVIGGILKGTPGSPQIDMETGLLTIPEWIVDERNLRNQLALSYRYFTAKYMTYPDYEKFGPADREFLLSLMRVSYLLGVRMEHEWLEELDVSLTSVTVNTEWKIPLQKAFKALGAKKSTYVSTDASQMTGPACDQLACVITIPKPIPKAKPKPKPTPPKQDDVQKVEIIIRSNK